MHLFIDEDLCHVVDEAFVYQANGMLKIFLAVQNFKLVLKLVKGTGV
jgi:hypothetical protein